MIAKDQSEATQQDQVYLHDSISLEEPYDTGNEWVAFKAILCVSGTNIIVKRYTSHDQCKRKMMRAADIKAFKINWYPNCVEYMGGSHPREEHPYTILRGVTSEHVSAYIALKFHEDNQCGSAEALKLLKDVTNALSYIVGKTNFPSFDISKVHLTDSGNIVVVDLEPCLEPAGKPKNNMPYWRSWQKICIELLSGDSAYEPNPAMPYYKDPQQRARLEYLRPILGHIHSGGLRFRDNIESAFKRQGLMLSQSLRRLENLQTRANMDNTPASSDVLLRALWHHSRELHYVASFRDPLDVDVGDIGYVTGNPPQFVRLDNVFDEISDGNIKNSTIPTSRSYPRDRWTTEEVQGIVRHTFRFHDSDAMNLGNCLPGQPQVAKDELLRRINSPNQSGLVVDSSLAWDCLVNHVKALATNHTEPIIDPSNLILGLLHA